MNVYFLLCLICNNFHTIKLQFSPLNSKKLISFQQQKKAVDRFVSVYRLKFVVGLLKPLILANHLVNLLEFCFENPFQFFN